MAKQKALLLSFRQQAQRSARPSLTDTEPEVVEGVLVDDVQLPHQGEGKLHHGADVHVLSVVLLQATRCKCWVVDSTINLSIYEMEKKST